MSTLIDAKTRNTRIGAARQRRLRPPPITNHKYIAWVERNSGDVGSYNFTVDGINNFRPITNTFIVSGQSTNTAMYDSFHTTFAGTDVRIIPGIKTTNLFPADAGTGWKHADNIVSWGLVALAVRDAAARARSSTMLLEMETTFDDYIAGNVTLNLADLRTGIKRLPTNLDYILWPSMNSTSKTSNDRRLAVMEIFCQEHNICHMGGRILRPVAIGNAEVIRASDQIDSVLAANYGTRIGSRRHRSLEMMWCYNDPGFNNWMDATTPTDEYVGTGIAASTPERTICIYPGSADWVNRTAALATIIGGL